METKCPYCFNNIHPEAKNVAVAMNGLERVFLIKNSKG